MKKITYKPSPGTWTSLRNEILYDTSISSDAVRLYLFILNMSNPDCTAGNEYICSLMSFSNNTLIKRLKELKVASYITTENVLDKFGSVSHRKITPLLKVGTKNTVQEDPQFTEFWLSYPRKINKSSAISEFNTIVDKETVLKSVKLYKLATDKWLEADKKYIPSPHNWLAAASFNEDPKSWIRYNTSKVPEVYKEDTTKVKNWTI